MIDPPSTSRKATWAVLAIISISLSMAVGCRKSPRENPGLYLGFFTYAGEAKFPENGIEGLQRLQESVGVSPASIMWYRTWDDPFPVGDCETVHACGATPHITWELFHPSQNPNNTRNLSPAETGLDNVLAGNDNDYIDRFARAGARWGNPVFIRFLHEFNGNWYTWSGNKNGGPQGGPDKVRRVWQYVVSRCRAQGATNFLWVWCPHGPSIDVSPEPWNRVEAYWPGDAYVDWFGIDAYNWYPRDPWGNDRPYRDFDRLLGKVYRNCLNLADKPVMIAEIASGEFQYQGIDKAQWITNLFRSLAKEPRIRMLVWFNIQKELDWRLDSSPPCLEAFRTATSLPWVKAGPLPADLVAAP